MRSEQRTDSGGLILRREHTDLTIERFAECASPRRWRAAVVDARDDVPALGQHQMKQVARIAKAVDDCLAGGLAVHVYQEWILSRRVHVWWAHDPRVEHHAAAGIDSCQLHRSALERREMCA